jgi:hypothetical protein
MRVEKLGSNQESNKILLQRTYRENVRLVSWLCPDAAHILKNYRMISHSAQPYLPKSKVLHS